MMVSEERNGVDALKIEASNLAASHHRLSLRSKTHHRSSQSEKKLHINDEENDAQQTLSSVEIADVQTDENNKIGAEDGDAEQKRQDRAKFDEVMSLMNKYDQAEAHIKWVNSPEYAQQKEQARENEVKR